MPLEYLALAVWCFVLAAAGGAVGLVLGNLRLPLVLVLSPSAAAGGAANLAISASAAATAAAAHVRAGRVNWRLFRTMAPPSVAGALLGGWLAGHVPERALLGAIAVVLGVSGVDALRRRPAPPRGVARDERGIDLRAAVWSGALIGLLGGLVGLLLGSLRMPALLRLVGESARLAVGTNTLVGVCVGVAGRAGHGPSAAPPVGVLAVGAAASVPGALAGARLAGRLSEPQLVRAVGVILVVTGAAVGARALA